MYRCKTLLTFESSSFLHENREVFCIISFLFSSNSCHALALRCLKNEVCPQAEEYCSSSVAVEALPGDSFDSFYVTGIRLRARI